MALTGSSTAEKIWNYLYADLKNEYGVAGLMGNLYAESGLTANNLQNTYNTKLGMTDVQYTAAVDNGTYTNFVKDSAGYGLAQWTYYTRKQAMYDYIVTGLKKSIGDLESQLKFLIKELSGSYSAVYKVLKNASSIQEASDKVLTGYEKPADQSNTAKTKRAKYGQTYYDTYATVTSSSTTTSTSTATSSTKKVTATKAASRLDKSIANTYYTTAPLNMRDGAGTKYKILVQLPKGTAVKNYGYYSLCNGVKWLYVQVTYNSTIYTGFMCSTYLKKK